MRRKCWLKNWGSALRVMKKNLAWQDWEQNNLIRMYPVPSFHYIFFWSSDSITLLCSYFSWLLCRIYAPPYNGVWGNVISSKFSHSGFLLSPSDIWTQPSINRERCILQVSWMDAGQTFRKVFPLFLLPVFQKTLFLSFIYLIVDKLGEGRGLYLHIHIYNSYYSTKDSSPPTPLM